jgi:VIT1/CCC1 family predicted Fe2+/Mn2+ transporter
MSKIPHHNRPGHPHEGHQGTQAALRDLVIGMSDGLTVPFALSAGLSGAVHSNDIILVAGMAEIVAGTISMGLGGYLAGQTEMDHYEGEKRREELEVIEIPLEEEQEIKELLAPYGISEEVRTKVASELSKDHKKWVDFMMRFELGLQKPDPKQAYMSALRIGLSYMIGGLIPLSAYLFCATPSQGLLYSAMITIVCLLIFGYWKAKLTGQNRLKGMLTVTFIGIAAAGAAFAIARWING